MVKLNIIENFFIWCYMLNIYYSCFVEEGGCVFWKSIGFKVVKYCIDIFIFG